VPWIVSGINSRCAIPKVRSLSVTTLDIPMAEIKSIAEPDGVGDDIGRESMALVGIHGAIVAISGS